MTSMTAWRGFSGLSDDLDIWLMPSGYVLLGVPESVRLLDEQAVTATLA